MSRATLLKFGAVALGGALVAVAASLPPQYQFVAEAMLWAAGMIKGSAMIQRPGDVKGL